MFQERLFLLLARGPRDSRTLLRFFIGRAWQRGAGAKQKNLQKFQIQGSPLVAPQDTNPNHLWGNLSLQGASLPISLEAVALRPQ